MAYTIRSLDDLSRSVRGAVRQYLPGTDASLKGNVLTVIGKVLALFAHEYELRLKWIFDQLFLTTATSEAIIRQHAAEYGIFGKPAAAASGTIEGTGTPSTTYPAGVRFSSAGFTYVTVAPFTSGALGSFSAMVQAEQTGAAGNREAGAALVLADPGLYPTILEDAVVSAGGLGGGADAEDLESLRARTLRRKATPPQGGALSDYERWALEVPGVVQVWAAQFSGGIGSIGAWVLFADRENGIPTEADLSAVEAYIVSKRLVRGAFMAVAPVPVAVDIAVRLSPDTSVQRQAVTAALGALFDATTRGTRMRPSLPDDPFVLPLAWISEAISTTPGESDHTLSLPEGDLVFQPGEIAVLGSIEWTS